MRRGHRQGSGERDTAPREIDFTLDVTMRLGPKMRWTKLDKSRTKAVVSAGTIIMRVLIGIESRCLIRCAHKIYLATIVDWVVIQAGPAWN